ncbi:MAG: helix-turn-helix domain-containing protein [Methanocorpusculum sp.]|nr:helix-turn-helix domain-containing protein [Methanocorpusculum sp.]
MQEENDNVVVIEQGSVEAQKIAKAMSSPTAADLFNTLSLSPMSATALSERTGFPLTTVKYHLENLLAAGLIEVTNTRWSAKGREMKIYAACDKVVVLAPRKRVDVRGIAERYGAIAGVIAIGCSLVLAIPQTLGQFAQSVPEAVPMFAAKTSENLMMTAAGAADSGSAAAMPALHSVIQVFFIGALVVLAVMMGYEMYKVRKTG